LSRDNLLKKIGLYKTLEILDIKGSAMKLRVFYDKLNKEDSYYNAFNRVKDTMIKTGIIKIYYGKTNRTKNIKLTLKGMTIKQTLNALLELME